LPIIFSCHITSYDSGETKIKQNLFAARFTINIFFLALFLVEKTNKRKTTRVNDVISAKRSLSIDLSDVVGKGVLSPR